MDSIDKKKLNLLKMKKHKINMTSVIVLGFVAIILIGALLLMLPVSSRSRTWTHPLDASFTAVSSTCVTGLVTVDTGSHWSAFGQAVIILLIQIGGLGFMTVAVLAALLFGKAVTPRDRMLVAMSYNLNSYESVVELVRRIALGTVMFEGIGALLLMIRFVPDYGARGIWISVFTSISAFCNAGFDVFGNNFGSLSAYTEDPLVNITIMLLILLGGVGFIVWSDILNFFRKRKRISVYSKMVLTMTVILVFGGALLIGAFEWNNEETIGNMPWYSKILASLFQSVTFRTAGFSAFDNGGMREASMLIGAMMMFIGGASGSTAGGTKMVTVAVMFYTVWCVAVGKKEIVISGRKISRDSFTKAVAVFAVQLFLVIVGTVIILGVTDFGLSEVLYEVASAVNTVGITAGITTSLGTVAKITLMLLMYFGRVGILTVAYAMSSRIAGSRNSSLTYPDANLLIG